MKSPQFLYLDYNATAPMLPSVLQSMMPAFEISANPSALHRWGQQAKRWINQAKHVLSDFIDASPENIIMTSGGTEANNLVLQGGAWDHVLVSPTVHDSSYRALNEINELSVDHHGLLKLDVLDSKLASLSQSSSRILVSVIHAHNESGVIQPLEEIVSLMRKYGAFLHVDATQSLGKIACSFKKFDADFLTLSSHKVGGPQGVGALIVRDASLISNPVIRGGGQERGYRSGTENVAGIVGFAEALKSYPRNCFPLLEKWHRCLEEDLKSFTKARGEEVYVYGSEVSRLPNTTCLTMPHVDAITQVMRFDLDNIGVSMGAACSSGRAQISRSLQHMGPHPSYANCAIRISSGWQNQENDFKRFSDTWKRIYINLKNGSMRHAS